MEYKKFFFKKLKNCPILNLQGCKTYHFTTYHFTFTHVGGGSVMFHILIHICLSM
jgi:hypothetical protein